MERWDRILNCMRLFDLDKTDGISIVDAGRFDHYHVTPFPPNHAVFVHGIHTADDLLHLKNVLDKVYPGDHRVAYVIIPDDRTECTGDARDISLEAIPQISVRGGEVLLHIPPMGHQACFEEFVEIIAHLRDPQGGCPWDLKQTHQTLRAHLISETYEVLSALDSADDDALAEELGDLLLQIVLHAQIASERGSFNMTQVIERIYTKIVGRHPHVFGDLDVNDVQGVLRNWEKLKAAERDAKQKPGEASPKKGLLDGVPLALPALIQAQEYLERTERIGLAWKSWNELVEEVGETLAKMRPDAREDDGTFGKILFDLANLASILHVDAESSLREVNQDFRKRLAGYQTKAQAQDLDLRSLNGEDRESLFR